MASASSSTAQASGGSQASSSEFVTPERHKRARSQSFSPRSRPSHRALYDQMIREAKDRKPATWTLEAWPNCDECEEYCASFEMEYVEGFKSYYTYTCLCYRCASAKFIQMPHKYTALNVWFH